MRIIAPMMILIMMTSTLAGCTGGDPDGGGNDEIDMDILNQLIDDNLQDFVNNTSVEVTNNYYEVDNSTTMNYVNGTSSSSSTLHTMAGFQSGITNILTDSEGIALLVRNTISTPFYPMFGLQAINGISICLEIGSVLEGYASSSFSSAASSFTAVGVNDLSEAINKFDSGECDAIIGSREVLENDVDSPYFGWITRNIAYSDGSQYQFNNYLTLEISQTSGESIFVEEIYASISIVGTCINCTSNQTLISRTISLTDTAVPEYSFSQGGSPMPSYYSSSLSGFSTCDYGLEQEFSGAGEMFAPGIGCTHELNLSVGYDYDIINGFSSGLDPSYDYSWGDWVYYVHWSSSVVEMH